MYCFIQVNLLLILGNLGMHSPARFQLGGNKITSQPFLIVHVKN